MGRQAREFTPGASASVDVLAGHAYTVAGMGPAAGLRLQVLDDALTTPPGRALVRVIQASLKQTRVTVTAGGQVLAHDLAFGSVTSYVPVKPGTWRVHVAGPDAAASPDHLRRHLRPADWSLPQQRRRLRHPGARLA